LLLPECVHPDRRQRRNCAWRRRRCRNERTERESLRTEVSAGPARIVEKFCTQAAADTRWLTLFRPSKQFGRLRNDADGPQAVPGRSGWESQWGDDWEQAAESPNGCLNPGLRCGWKRCRERENTRGVPGRLAVCLRDFVDPPCVGCYGRRFPRKSVSAVRASLWKPSFW
jgi:hypothetical protein